MNQVKINYEHLKEIHKDFRVISEDEVDQIQGELKKVIEIMEEQSGEAFQKIVEQLEDMDRELKGVRNNSDSIREKIGQYIDKMDEIDNPVVENKMIVATDRFDDWQRDFKVLKQNIWGRIHETQILMKPINIHLIERPKDKEVIEDLNSEIEKIGSQVIELLKSSHDIAGDIENLGSKIKEWSDTDRDGNYTKEILKVVAVSTFATVVPGGWAMVGAAKSMSTFTKSMKDGKTAGQSLGRAIISGGIEIAPYFGAEAASAKLIGPKSEKVVANTEKKMTKVEVNDKVKVPDNIDAKSETVKKQVNEIKVESKNRVDYKGIAVDSAETIVVDEIDDNIEDSMNKKLSKYLDENYEDMSTEEFDMVLEDVSEELTSGTESFSTVERSTINGLIN